VFGYHVTDSTGTLFLCGIEVGVIGLAGLNLLLAGAAHRPPRQRRPSRAPAVPPGYDRRQPGPR
jgi:hypothetical protein